MFSAQNCLIEGLGKHNGNGPRTKAGPAKQFLKCGLVFTSFAEGGWAGRWILYHYEQNIYFLRRQGRFVSLRKQRTFGDATTGFPAKWRLRNERKNSIYWWRVTIQICVVLLTGRAACMGNLIQPIRSTTQLDSDASSEVSRKFLRSFLRRNLAGKQVVAPPNVGCFLRLQICLFSFCGCLELPGYWTFHESLLSWGMFLSNRWKGRFSCCAFGGYAHAGFTRRSLQIMTFLGSCYSLILSRMSSKHVQHLISQPLMKALYFRLGF